MYSSALSLGTRSKAAPVSHNHSSDTSSAEGIDGAAIAISPSLVGVAALVGLHAFIVRSMAHPGWVQVPLPLHLPHSHTTCALPRTTSPSDVEPTRRTFERGFLKVALVGASSSHQTLFIEDLARGTSLSWSLNTGFALVRVSKRVHSQATGGLINKCASGRAVQSTARSKTFHFPSCHAHVERPGHFSPLKRGVGVRNA